MEYAAGHGVRLMIENCPMENWQRFGLPGNYAYSPELWEALFNEVPAEAFGLNFDPSHLYWLGIDYLRAAKEFAPKIFHAHAKDTEFLADGAYRYGTFGRQIEPIPWKSGWWRYRIPGLGRIDWRTLVIGAAGGGIRSCPFHRARRPVWEGSEEKVKHGLALGLKHLSQFVVVEGQHAIAALKQPYVPFGTQYYRAPSPPPTEMGAAIWRTSPGSASTTVKFWVQWRWNNPAERTLLRSTTSTA